MFHIFIFFLLWLRLGYSTAVRLHIEVHVGSCLGACRVIFCGGCSGVATGMCWVWLLRRVGEQREAYHVFWLVVAVQFHLVHQSRGACQHHSAYLLLRQAHRCFWWSRRWISYDWNSNIQSSYRLGALLEYLRVLTNSIFAFCQKHLLLALLVLSWSL